MISIAIPFFNEEECLDSMVDSLTALLEAQRVDYELILVDNGSWDKTGALIDRKTAANPRLKKVVVKKNEGYGNGIIHGLNAARGEIIGFMCGDGQIRAEDVIAAMKYALTHDCDMVKVRRIERHDSLLRRVVTGVYNLCVPPLFGLKTRDLNGTPKLFRRELLAPLDLQSKDWFIDAEAIIKLEHLRSRIEEIPVVFEARKGGGSHVTVFKAIMEFVRNVWRFKTGIEFRQWKKSRQSSSRAAKAHG